ncbi:aldolase catalytic domain-containing protein [Ruminococcus sp. NK3A76]|uniref:aldolase catalytic domain-containing protein n=1 Tax=Ruminococcus sp. NK3A76 TaxID=877411 RepID=UPI00048F0833|nr:aldolase catalytic domain-containing protein [Ruminococcus sp. NK3A76]
MRNDKLTPAQLMGFREQIKVLDATVRDGGLVNSFRFTDEFVRDLYKTNVQAGVDYMELGYKADKAIFNVDDFGKWKFCNEDDIRDIVGDNDTDLKLSIMADVGRCDYKNDIIDRANSAIDMVRVATYVSTMPAAIDMIEDAARKGYETTCNIMAISNAQESDIDIALDMLGKSPVNGVYIVDSFGSLIPEQVKRISTKYLDMADKYGKQVGIHAHNNQQLAFANTIEALSEGVNYIDATYDGMGRGAGNCAMELLLGFLKNPKYKLYPVIKFIEQHMNKLREDGVLWGYGIPYMVTGQFNQHPREAIAFSEALRKDYTEFYKHILDMNS